MREYKMEDVFGNIDDIGFSDFEDPFSVDSHPASVEETKLSFPSTLKLNSLPWKSPQALFFTPGYFVSDEWRDRAAPVSIPTSSGPFDHSPTELDYFETFFEVLEAMGRGSFSDVFRTKRKSDGCVLALKRSRSPFSGIVDRYRRLHEVENMWLSSGHPNCIQIFESWEQHGYLYILMELCDNGRYCSLSSNTFVVLETSLTIWLKLTLDSQSFRSGKSFFKLRLV
jgi:hypothetical protein